MPKVAKYHVLGIMSGTSLDGLDIAECEFLKDSDTWRFSILNAETITFPDQIRHLLNEAVNLPSQELLKLDVDLGRWMGKQVAEFMQRHNSHVEFIGSHGHTVFHQPENSLTLQIGNGNAIWQTTNIPVINDFRTADVIAGGQGAPLVPIGDKLLFSEYRACVNIGGIANISFDQDGKRHAYDICEANMVLNYLSHRLGKAYDEAGAIAKSGSVINKLLKELKSQKYYGDVAPKSLGFEWVQKTILPLLSEEEYPNDLLRTLADHISSQIAESVNKVCSKLDHVLITGGGVHNDFLVEQVIDKCQARITIPKREMVDFKEAMIFAFLAVLRARNETNILSSVTGAKFDQSAGVLHGQFTKTNQ